MKVIQSNIIRLAGGVLLLAFPLPMMGVEEADPVELDPYEVEANRIEMAEDLITAGVDVLDVERTGRQAAGSLGEVLSWQPGVSSSFYGAGASRPVVRGMEGYRVGVYDSGLSTGDLSASSPDHAVAIEPLFVREISLHRGAAALLHGGGAIGGAVDTVPDFIPDDWTQPGWDADMGVIFESVNDARTVYAKGGNRTGPWAFRVNALDRESEDYGIPGFARTSEYDLNNRLRLPPEVQGKVAPNQKGRVINTWTRTRVGALGVGWMGGNAAMQGAYQRYESRYGVPLDGHTHGNPFGVPGLTGPSPNDGVTIDLTQERGLGQTRLDIDLGPLDQIELKGALTRFRQQESEGRFLSNDFCLDGADVQMEAGGQFKGVRFFTGFEWTAHDFKNRNISYNAGRADEDFLRTDSVGSAAYVLGEFKLALSHFRLGGRLDWQRADRADLQNVSRTDTTGSGVVEVVQSLGDTWQVILSLGNTSRIPNADELYIEAPHGATGVFQIPNPQLAIERTSTIELRIQRRSERFQFSASAYYRDFDGYVFLENQGFEVDGLTAYALVQRDAVFTGGEVEATWVFYAEPERTGLIGVFGDTVHATDKVRDQPLPRIPPIRVGGSLKFSIDRWKTEIAALHAFEQDRVPREVFGTLAYQSPSAAYTLLTFRVERRFEFEQAAVIADLEVSNLLDEEARQHTSFLKDVAPLPGRSLQVSLRLDF